MDERRMVKVAKALGDATRFAILRAIVSAGEISCGEVAARFPIAQATVSHHLRILGESDLVAVRREGQHSYFRLVPETLAAYRDALDELTRGARRGRPGRAAAIGNIDS